MDYTVYDLLRILGKRWYVIVLSVVFFSILSVFTSRQSFQKAQEDYLAYTTESSEIDQAGTLESYYLCDYRISDFKQYNGELKRKTEFYAGIWQSIGYQEFVTDDMLNELTEQAYAEVDSTFQTIFQSATLLNEVQSAANEAKMNLDVATSLSTELLNSELLKVTITGLDKNNAIALRELYFETLISVAEKLYAMNISYENTSDLFTVDQSATQFAQMIMEEPKEAPDIIKTMGTAGVLAFALSCFGILVVTFIKDNNKRDTSLETQ